MPEKIFDKLRAAGIKQYSGSYLDYERAKKLLLPDVPPEWYEKTIEIITMYLGV